VTENQRQDSFRELEQHEQAIAELSAALDAIVGPPPARARPDVLFLNAQLIRHRISMALIVSRLAAK
jgi:hypothetical protein